MTLDLNEFYGVSVIHAEKIGPRNGEVRGTSFDVTLKKISRQFLQKVEQ